MMTPALRWLISVLTDAATGVNAELPNVPRPVGQDAPAQVLYYDALQHPWAAKGLIPRDALKEAGVTKPGLIIRVLLPEDGIVAPVLPEFLRENPAIVPVAALYASRKVAKDANPLTASIQARDAYDTIRTAMRCVAKKLEDAHTSFEVDDCTLRVERTGVILDTDYVDVGDDEILARIIVPIEVEDRWALGIT